MMDKSHDGLKTLFIPFGITVCPLRMSVYSQRENQKIRYTGQKTMMQHIEFGLRHFEKS